MLLFQTENLSTVAPHVSQLLQAHWDEVEASMHGAQEYVLNGEQYEMYEQLNMLHISTARLPQGDVCGYAAFTICPCPHKQDTLLAQLDALYLIPEQRQGTQAVQLLRHAEQALQKRGVGMVQYASPASKPCDALYRRLGAKLTEHIYHKTF